LLHALFFASIISLANSCTDFNINFLEIMSSSAISILIFSLFWAQFPFHVLNSVRLRLLSFIFFWQAATKIKALPIPSWLSSQISP
jgi:hypothetical protein